MHIMEQQEQESVSAAQFARETGLSLQHVYSLLASGKLPAAKRDGCWAIPARELDKRQSGRLVPMSGLLPGSPEYTNRLLERLTDLSGEVSRLRKELADIYAAVEKAQELTERAITREGAEILAKESTSETVK